MSIQDLRGKRVLVTGSTRGIGLQIARSFLDEDCYVAINGRDKVSTKEIVASFNSEKVIGCPGDLTKLCDSKEVLDLFLKKFGGLDILVCNVGSGKSVPPGEEDFEEWQKMLSINLLSATTIINLSKDHLISSTGVIVCISSICGSEVIPGAPIAYSASKAALNSFVKSSSRPLGKKGVRINAIAPGNIIFKDSVWDSKLKDNPDLVKSMLTEEVPLNDFGHTKDVANLALFLSSSSASNITGQVIITDGGQTRG